QCARGLRLRRPDQEGHLRGLDDARERSHHGEHDMGLDRQADGHLPVPIAARQDGGRHERLVARVLHPGNLGLAPTRPGAGRPGGPSSVPTTEAPTTSPRAGRSSTYQGAVRIGQLSTLSGTSAKTIRYYEDIGVLPAPPRTAGGYREYDSAAARRLAFVRAA